MAEDVITRPDLADRAIFLTLPYVHDTRRRPEKDIWREFELAQPPILGALLNAASHGLRRLPEVRLDRLPRMADFDLWASACETAVWPAGTFLRACEANRRARGRPRGRLCPRYHGRADEVVGQRVRSSAHRSRSC
jgi:hypothetical protein